MCGGGASAPAGPTAAEAAATARATEQAAATAAANERAKLQAQVDATNRSNLLKKKAQANVEGRQRLGNRNFLQQASAGLQEEGGPQPTQALVAKV